METKMRTNVHLPWSTNPRNRKINKTRPVRRKLCDELSIKHAFCSKAVNLLFSAVSFGKSRETREYRFSWYHRITENHEKTANDTQVAKEKVHVENEAITETLNDNDSEKASDRVFCISLWDNTEWTRQHDLLYGDWPSRALSSEVKTYNNIDEKEEMRETPREMTVPEETTQSVPYQRRTDELARYSLLQVPQLVAPLSNNSQRILQERHNNKKTPNCWQMGFQRLRIDLDVVFNLFANSANLLEWIVRVGSPVTRGWPRIGQAMGVYAVGACLWARYADSWGHGGKWRLARMFD